ncbi:MULTISPECIES: amino acid ABC transporter substrate-binding protein [unclassified Staphylococcus]|uniref:amino acid ABC transporter substrate-binding protein n=1 Tax=unclassified Staphylococcus TaxID=91994 RepID=UPI0021CEAC35|nr:MULTISPECIES: amino acid ABC transporter substrate-binding protein [unclassified Staphylococcus]UXR69226.1 amino acid ABC transporter substrate-binding protein [Staphylococcus sp. IVB6246]UXR71279.1 amino acid ABC transporter substrate-binding protein [Staphylococcus sp. IVB6240]UXR73555.1 amino acid ABC transporter substrate-binding protein [Staphylococcus sp. IVB6238]UXR75871.1 amino acid ABC transporter substrate-binding protein [Staphylococcus sp. IVB6233]UXR80068.1 amino acid ABC trans
MKRILFLMVAFAIVLAACGNNNDSKDSSSKNEDKKIVVGTEGTYAPFTFHDKNDKLTGYDVEVTKAVAKEMGYEVEFKETQWDSMFAGLDAGRFDVVANQVGINDERKAKYKFSDPYTYSNGVLVVAEDNNDIKSFDDVKDRKLAQTLTSNYGKLAESKGAEITKVDGFNQAMDLLQSNRVEGTFNDNISYLDYKKQKPNAKIKAIEGDAEQSQSAFAFSKKTDDKVVEDFNKGLKKLKDNGELEKISKKWFGENVSEPK